MTVPARPARRSSGAAGVHRVAVLAMGAVGHLNPMLALVAALTAHRTRPRVRAYATASTASLFRSAGAIAEYRADQGGPAGPPAPLAHAAPAGREDSRISALAVRNFIDPQRGLADLVKQVRGFRPHVIVHDVFDLSGKVAAHALGVPAAAVLPFAGLRALGGDFPADTADPAPEIVRANARLRRDFGVDVLGDAACLPVLFPSRDLSMVTAIEQQSPPEQPATARLSQLERSLGSALAWTGPWLGSAHWTGVAPGFPWERISRAREDGRRVVLFSLGTNITTFRRDSPMGGAPSGLAFARAAMDLLVAAFGADPDVQLIVATGDRDGQRTGPGRGWPPGAVVCAAVPQRRLLASGVSTFISHHGYNSSVEAVVAGTRMVALPGYGDQITNAAFCIRQGVSVAHWDLDRSVQSCSPGALRQAVEEAATGGQEALRSLRDRLLGAGGARLGASLVLGLAS